MDQSPVVGQVNAWSTLTRRAAVVRTNTSRNRGKQRTYTPGRESRKASSLRRALPTAVFVVTSILFLPAVSGSAVALDDKLYTNDRPVSDGLDAESIRFAFTNLSREYWHPLAWLSAELDNELFGAAPAWRHDAGEGGRRAHNGEVIRITVDPTGAVTIGGAERVENSDPRYGLPG